MEDSVETSAKTVAEAVELALLRLGLRRRDVEIEVLSEGRPGLFGLGAEDARVRVRRLVSGPPAAAGAAEPAAPVSRPPRVPRRAVRAAPEDRGGIAAEPQEDSLPLPPPAAPFPAEDLLEEETFEAEDEELEDDLAPAPRRSRATDHEIAVAGREVLEELLEYMGIYADVKILESESKGIILDITGPDLGVLIGRRGSTLASLQFITNLILGKRFQYRAKVMVDVEGYRQRREQSLIALARRMADQVRSTRQSVTLEAMAPAERRIVHLALQADPDVTTQSSGEGEGRKVTILLRR